MTVHKRKQFWVDAPLQFQMLAYVLALVTASLLIVSFSMLHGLREASAESRQIFHSLDWVQQNLRGPMLLSASLCILASGLLTLLWSHRFAGPLRVLSAAVSRVSQGNLSAPVRVRATDAHQELVREFSEMQRSLHVLVDKDRKIAEAVSRKLHKVLGEMPAGDARRELEGVCEELRGVASGFQL